MTPKTKDELDALLRQIQSDWLLSSNETWTPNMWAPYLRQRLADAGVQMVPMPDRGSIARSMVELSPFYTEPRARKE